MCGYGDCYIVSAHGNICLVALSINKAGERAGNLPISKLVSRFLGHSHIESGTVANGVWRGGASSVSAGDIHSIYAHIADNGQVIRASFKIQLNHGVSVAVDGDIGEVSAVVRGGGCLIIGEAGLPVGGAIDGHGVRAGGVNNADN